jgi:hypothetical protein
MTRQTWEEERDARILARIERMIERVDITLAQILERLPPLATFNAPGTATMAPAPVSEPAARQKA